MDGYDFTAQYLFVVFGVLCAAFRDAAPLMVNNNVERLIREKRLAAVYAARARAILALMQKERVA